jgi:threonine dehydrogenase-like Zn-dependent dehydrogenase
MKAAVLTEYGKFQWQETDDPKITDTQLLIKVNYAGICGTDLHIFKGEFDPRTKLPLIPGHEFAGRVVEIGASVTKFGKGDKVVIDPIIWCGKCAACRIGHYPACTSLKLLGVDMNGGFGEYVAVEESMLYKLDEQIPERDAALIEVFSIGFHAANRAGVQSDDTVAIWGAGRIGQSILQAVRTKTKNTVFMVDIVDNRLNIPQGSYDNVIPINAKKEDPISVIKEYTDGDGADIAIEAVGHAVEIEGRANPIQSCIGAIRGAGTVSVLGLTGEPVSLYMRDLIWKEAKIITSRVSHGEYSEAIEHLSKGDLHPELMITEVMPAKDIQKAFKLLETNPEKYLKIMLAL